MTDKEFKDILDQHIQLEYDGKTLIVQYNDCCVALYPDGEFNSKYSAYANCFWWANEYVQCCKQLEKWRWHRNSFDFAWQCYDAIKNVMPYQVEIACKRSLGL